MGVVWVGHALALGVEVAVKLIRASVAGPAVSSRMAREAHAAARLCHPALVRVFDFGWTNRGDPYLVMELVQGETLSALLDRETRISAIRAVQMLLPIADGLRLAHDRAIVHRDIKPDNIFLATDPLGRVQPKLLDFGIAKVGPGNVDARLTQVGVVLGSPEYMSPEQALGAEDVDERTDVWSVAVVLYEMVTGAMPFRKANYNALMQAIIHEPPVPMTDFAEGDESLWSVVSRGLAKERDERWSTMAELGEALALWLYEHGIKEDVCGNSIRAVWLDRLAFNHQGESVPTPAPLAPHHTPPGPPRARLYSANAPTQARPALGARFRAMRLAGQRRPILVAAALGAVTGGFIATTLLGRSSAMELPPTATTGSPRVSLAASVSSPSSSAPTASSASSNEAEATPVERLPTEQPGASAGSARPRSSGASTHPARLQSKNKRHDFGF
jgi:serine/threonine-protein kinase